MIVQVLKCPAKNAGHFFIFPCCISHDVRSYTGFTNKARRKNMTYQLKAIGKVKMMKTAHLFS